MEMKPRHDYHMKYRMTHMHLSARLQGHVDGVGHDAVLWTDGTRSLRRRGGWEEKVEWDTDRQDTEWYGAYRAADDGASMCEAE